MAEEHISYENLSEYDGYLRSDANILKRDTDYVEGNIVNKGQVFLKCTQSGKTKATTLSLSGVSVGDTLADGTAEWEVVSINGIPQGGSGIDLTEWEQNTEYKAGTYLVYGGTIYKVINDFTSGTTFDDTDLTSYVSPIMKGATSSADGEAGMVPKPNSTDADKFLKGDGTWGSASGGILIWQANTAYNVNDVVIDSNLIWQCAIAHTSTTTFDESKWICISGGEISNGMEIVPLWEGEFSFSNATGGATPTSSTSMIELSESIDNFEYIYIETALLAHLSDPETHGDLCSVKNRPFRAGLVASNDYYSTVALVNYDNTHLYAEYTSSSGWSAGNVTAIKGIRKAKPIVSSGMKYETLWEGEAGNLSGVSGGITINLSESLKRYQKFGVQVKCRFGSENRYYYREFDASSFMNWLSTSISNGQQFSISWGYANTDDCVDFNHTSTDVQLMFNCNNSIITKIIGISEGVQIPTGVQAARVTLWEGSAGGSTITLLSELYNYDKIELTASCINSGILCYYTGLVDVATLKLASISNEEFLFAWGYGSSTNYVSIENSTNTTMSILTGDTSRLTKITGIKYIQPDSYSTEEKLIGTWIDGKPLYQKTFTGNTPSSNNTEVTIITLPEGTNVHSIEGYVLDGNSACVPLNFYYDSTTNISTYCNVNRKIQMKQYAYGNQPYRVTLKYTKTTN